MLGDNGDFSSGDLLKKVMINAFPAMPKVKLGIVDVRDAAYAHLQAVKVEEAKGKRILLCSDSLWFKEVATYLSEEFPELKINTKEMKYCLLKFASWFDKDAAGLVPMWGNDLRLNN